MKTIKKISILAVCVSLFLLSLFVSGCSDAKVSSASDSSSVTAQESADSELIKGFNDYYGCVATVYGNVFGRAEVNNDAAYITEGEGSIHLLVQGQYSSKNYYPNIRYGNDMFENKKTNNFTDYSAVALDCYNDNASELHIMFHLTVYDTDGALADTPTVIYSLAPEKWTTIVYDLSDGSIKAAFNSLKNVYELVIQFPEYKSAKDDENNSFYLDNLVGIKGNTSAYSTARADGEMMFFDNLSDINILDTRFFNTPYYYENCFLSQNTDKRFISQGSGSLRIDRFENNNAIINVQTCCLPETLLSGKSGVSLDVFNAADASITVTVSYSTDTIETGSVSCTVAGNSKGKVSFDISGSTCFESLQIAFSWISEEHEVSTCYIDNFVRW